MNESLLLHNLAKNLSTFFLQYCPGVVVSGSFHNYCCAPEIITFPVVLTLANIVMT